WKPIAGPPARIWSCTPVSTPPCATSSPVTDFAPALIVGLGPSSSYWAPCSASGFQSVCSTIVDGQPAALRLSAAGMDADELPAVDPVLALLLLLPLEHAVAVTASAAPTAAAAASLILRGGIKWFSRWSRPVTAGVQRVGRPAALPVREHRGCGAGRGTGRGGDRSGRDSQRRSGWYQRPTTRRDSQPKKTKTA